MGNGFRKCCTMRPHVASVLFAYTHRKGIWQVDQKHDACRIDEEGKRDLPGVADRLLGDGRVPLVGAHAFEHPLSGKRRGEWQEIGTQKASPHKHTGIP